MENGRSNQIIEKLINNIENGQNVPLSTGKVMVNKDETVLMLRQLESIVDSELKTYREVNDKRGKIITDAKKQAEEIISEAEQTASRIRVTKRVSSFGSGFNAKNLDNDDRMALRTANDIYAASLIYTDEMLTEVNDLLLQAYDYVNKQYGRMLSDLDEKARVIANNKVELMSNLKELSKEDRYEQILELAQLLSNELYSERKRMKEMQYEEKHTDSMEDTDGLKDKESLEDTDNVRNMDSPKDTGNMKTADKGLKNTDGMKNMAAHKDNATDRKADVTKHVSNDTEDMSNPDIKNGQAFLNNLRQRGQLDRKNNVTGEIHEI